MRYHLKERAWSLTEAFLVRNDAGKPVFDIRGKFFHIGDDLVLYDHQSRQELIHLKQRLLSLLPSYDIYRNGQHLANVHEQFRFFGERFQIKGEHGMVMHIDGDIWNWNFSISDAAGNLMARVGREFSLFRDSYAVDIAQGVDAAFIVALAVVIEMVKEHHEKKRDER
jgi:uncharacterized protein YxjI